MTVNDIKGQLKQYLGEISGENDDQNLLELGLNSLQVVRLVNSWRKQGIRVSFGQLMESPTIKEWSEIISEVVEGNQSSAVELYKDVKTSEFNDGSFKLTDVQYAYWVGRQDDQALGGVGCHAYLEYDGVSISANRLENAFNQVQSHHPMLRAKFSPDGTQHIMDKPYSTKIRVNDLSGLSESECADRENDIRSEWENRRLKVEEGQVAGIGLTQYPNGKSRIHVDMDLMIADVQSLQILLRDLCSAYRGQKLPETSKNWSFKKYLEHDAAKDSEKYTESKAYWNERLDSLPAGPELPMSKHPESLDKTKFTRRVMRLDKNVWSALKGKAAKYKLTPAMILLTAYATILERWSTKKKFLINMPLFNRQTEVHGIEDAIADFTTLLLLEIDCVTNRNFKDLAHSIQSQFHKDMQHSDYSGVQIQRDLSQKHGRFINAAPIVFACNLGIPLTDQVFHETLGIFYYMTSQTPQVWLDFQTYEEDGGLMLTWDSIDDLFAENLIQDMFESFEVLLHTIHENEWDQGYDVLPKHQVEHFERECEVGLLENPKCLHEPFIEQVQKTPNATALVDLELGKSYTYQELFNKAKAVASRLIQEKVSNEAIAVSLPRGVDQISVVLGIIMAGNHYVPVSLAQPAERRNMIHEKTNIQYIITGESYLESVQWPSCKGLFTTEDIEKGQYESVELPKVSPKLSAYIIMTSGSTGTPKGVDIAHESAWNTIKDINKRYAVSSLDSVLSVSALDFDLSVYDIFGLLAVGGKVVTLPEKEYKNPDFWLKSINKHNISIWNTVPILFEMLLVVSRFQKNKDFSLRLSLLSGDWIPMDLPQKLFELTDACRLIGLGGATEASIWSNHQDIVLPMPQQWKSVPYGRPLSGQTYRVVDDSLKDCPFWVPGELLIGGHGVAKGYRGDKKLTESKFFEAHS